MSRMCWAISLDSASGFGEMRRLGILLLLLLSASGVAGAEDDNAMRLTVKPMLCIIDERTPSCQLAFLVVWESDRDGYYCLFNDFGEAALRCWNSQRKAGSTTNAAWTSRSTTG